MNALIDLLKARPGWIVALTLFGKALWDSFTGAFPAPTANSGQFYRFLFTFVNLLAFNIHRATNPAIEQSPNFLPAARKLLAEHPELLQPNAFKEIQPAPPPTPNKEN